ncbi:protein of unknown function (plasmid) [Cupriavidus taiwanensis]|nr:protein of unknown function [Cupriavidus taiwanensis]
MVIWVRTRIRQQRIVLVASAQPGIEMGYAGVCIPTPSSMGAYTGSYSVRRHCPVKRIFDKRRDLDERFSIDACILPK